jgi:oxygen-independent coproporphyrinogen-3 oxidase
MTPIERDTMIEEILIIGLRLAEGISRSRLEEMAGCTVDKLFGARLDRLVDGGFLTLDDQRLGATAAGRQRLNAVLAALLA